MNIQIRERVIELQHQIACLNEIMAHHELSQEMLEVCADAEQKMIQLKYMLMDKSEAPHIKSEHIVEVSRDAFINFNHKM